MNLSVDLAQLVKALQSICIDHRKSFAPVLARQQSRGSYSISIFQLAMLGYGSSESTIEVPCKALYKEIFSLIACIMSDSYVKSEQCDQSRFFTSVLVLHATGQKCLWLAHRILRYERRWGASSADGLAAVWRTTCSYMQIYAARTWMLAMSH